jgi:hypothetical protein
MGRPTKFTEDKIKQMERDGFGRGVGASYQPWIEVTSFSSLGRSRRIFSSKTGRAHHLLSDVEYHVFIGLEWQQNITDIREQFPLDRATTLSVAQKIGIKHPYYPGTQIASVMTVDFMVTKKVDGKDVLVAFNAKRTEEAQDEHSMLKLEIQRATLALVDIKHHVVFHDDIPLNNIRNIGWIRDGILRRAEAEKEQDFWDVAKISLKKFILTNVKLPLYQVCKLYDKERGYETGTSIRAAKMLLWERQISTDLGQYPIINVPAENFQDCKILTHT